MELYEYDATESGNNPILASQGGMPEDIDRDAVNLGHRHMMAAMRRYYDDPEWIRPRIQGPTAGEQGTFARTSATQFQINLSGVDLTGYFEVGRIVKIVDGVSAGVDLVTQVVSRSYSDPVTTVNITATDSIAVGATDAYSYFSSIVRGLALLDSQNNFFVPASDDAAGINAAIVAADAAGGGTVLLTSQVYTLEAAIDLATYGRVKLVGAGPEVTLIQAAATSIDPLITMGNASKPNVIENLQINKNGNAGTILEIDGQVRPRCNSVIFIDGTDQVEFTATQTINAVFERCLFTLYTHHGIVGNGPADNHGGIIQACRFQGSAVASSDPAGIKLAGVWNIDGNYFGSMGHASLTSRAIWLWNETGGNGGRKSVVSNNNIDADNGVTGYGIEVGGDFIVVSGNRVNAASSGYACVVRPTQAGQTASYITISGNTFSRSNPLWIIGGTANAVDITVSGNTLVADSGRTGLQISADQVTVVGNHIVGGAKGIVLDSTSAQCSIQANHLRNQTTSIIDVGGSLHVISGNMLRPSVVADAFVYENTVLGARVLRNTLIGTVTGDLHSYTAGSTLPSIFAIGNDESELDPFAPNDQAVYSGTASTVNTAETALFTGAFYPGEVGTGRFDLAWTITENGGSNNVQIRIRIGPNGDASDPLIYDSGSILPSASWTSSGTRVEAAAGHQITITGQDLGGGGTGSNLSVDSFTATWRSFS